MEEELHFERSEILKLIGVQALLLLIFSFTWVFINPEIPLFSAFKPFSAQMFFWAALGSLLLLALSFLVFFFSSAMRESFLYVDHLLLCHLKRQDALFLAVMSGLSEEIFFRGVLQQRFGIVVASILFGLLHMPSRKMWPYGLWATVAGFFMGAVFLWTEDLTLVIFLHVFNNLIALLLWKKWRHRYVNS